jgi:uncharacterized protein YutE (UPF0331/DUF86 family)
MQDVILNKIRTIQRCINRINEEYIGYEDEFEKQYAKQDSVILNLERASQASIDIATHIIKVEGFGMPNRSRELFDLLEENSIISNNSSIQMKKMVGFRNIAVHDYQSLNLEIVVSIIEKHLEDFDNFIKEIFENYLSTQPS